MSTHTAPTAGPTALKSDIAVIAMPFAAPLWSWSYCYSIRYSRNQIKDIRWVEGKIIKSLSVKLRGEEKLPRHCSAV